jgi:DNA polymerase epsilon subunit 1
MSGHRGGGGRERSVLHTGGGFGGGGRGGYRGGKARIYGRDDPSAGPAAAGSGGGGSGGRGSGGSSWRGGGVGGGAGASSSRGDDFRAVLAAMRAAQREADQDFDARSGYARLEEGRPRDAYLVNFLPATLVGEDRLERSCIDCYFLQEDGETFKATVAYEPYFYVALASHRLEREVIAALERKFEGLVSSLTVVTMEDLEMPNHLAGHKRRLLKLSFRAVNELMRVRNQLRPVIEKNQATAARGENLEVSERRGNKAQRRLLSKNLLHNDSPTHST